MPLAIHKLEHINLRTANLAAMSRFYREILGFELGYRPPFKSTGEWLYRGDVPMIHLVEVAQAPRIDQLRMEHFAVKASGLDEFLSHLRTNEVPYQISVVPEVGIRQVNIFNPDDNHIELQFAPDDSPNVDLSAFRLTDISRLLARRLS